MHNNLHIYKPFLKMESLEHGFSAKKYLEYTRSTIRLHKTSVLQSVFNNGIFLTPKNTVSCHIVFSVFKNILETPVSKSVFKNGIYLSVKTALLDCLFVTKSFKIPGKYLVFWNKLKKVP